MPILKEDRMARLVTQTTRLRSGLIPSAPDHPVRTGPTWAYPSAQRRFHNLPSEAISRPPDRPPACAKYVGELSIPPSSS
jgi:hypothetical protein